MYECAYIYIEYTYLNHGQNMATLYRLNGMQLTGYYKVIKYSIINWYQLIKT